MTSPTRLCLLLAAAASLFGQKPTFEAASIRPSDPNRIQGLGKVQQMMADILPVGFLPVQGSQVNLVDRSLLNLIATAYSVRTTRISAPDWMNEARFDIVAKLPADTQNNQSGEVNEMLQALLEDRFGLKLHSESRDVAGYALVVGRNGPAMKSSAPGATDSLTDDDARKQRAEDQKADLQKKLAGMKMNGAGQTMSLHNATMEMLADRLTSIVHAPVADLTGLGGNYDIDLDLGPQDRETPPEDRVAAALPKLGLKLEKRKVPGVFLVVDAASKTPTPN